MADGYTTVGKMWHPSLYIGSIIDKHDDRVAILPPRIKESMPSPEPKPGEAGWLYRVLEPYYSRECVDNVMAAMLEGQISSGASWPRKLAAEVCSLYQVPVALPTSSGASALHVALLACNLGPHDHVLVPTLTMVAVANMVKMVGAKPVYCDCAEGSVNPGVAELKQKATPRTKAVIVCHTYGIACRDIAAISELCKEKGWWLVEDICEAMGTKADTGELVGTFGDFAVTSLYANKPITAGDGGWVHAKDQKHHDRLKSLINHGFDPAYHFLHFETAPNAKMNGLGAAFVCSQVKMLPRLMQHRGQVANWYREGLAGITELRCIEQRQIDAPWVFGVETKDRQTRDKLRDHLAAKGIETRNYFYPLHLEPVNFYGDDVGVYDVVLPRAESLAQVGFYLPTHSFLEQGDVQYICSILRSFYQADSAVSAPRKHGWVDAVAALCSALSRRCEQQAQAQRQLEEQLRASEAEASALRRELAELRSGEALRAQRLAAREVAVDSWEAGRLKELPKLKAELKERLASQAEAHYQELEQQARRRLATAERAFHEQVRDLETELNEARAENAALGRKCFESYQARAQAQAASSQTQQQAQMQHQELHQLRANQTLMQQEPFTSGFTSGDVWMPKCREGPRLDALTASKNTDAILIGLRLVSSKAELLGNHLQLAEVVARHLASPTPEAASCELGEAGARYSDHVAAVIRWPTPLVRLAAVEVDRVLGGLVIGILILLAGALSVVTRCR
ncbi:unnamed protein product [Effrenium voratum]|nr:unnamed protein product [Effrenium voratum]